LRKRYEAVPGSLAVVVVAQAPPPRTGSNLLETLGSPPRGERAAGLRGDRARLREHGHVLARRLALCEQVVVEPRVDPGEQPPCVGGLVLAPHVPEVEVHQLQRDLRIQLLDERGEAQGLSGREEIVGHAARQQHRRRRLGVRHGLAIEHVLRAVVVDEDVDQVVVAGGVRRLAGVGDRVPGRQVGLGVDARRRVVAAGTAD
jgi:hypothetical protein